MLPILEDFGSEVTLVMNSGIQFLDFGLKIDWKDRSWREKANGNFNAHANGSWRRLILNKSGEGYCDPDQPGIVQNSYTEISVEQSLKLLDGQWLPIPVLRSVPPDRFDEGPYNWARARIVSLRDGEDADGNTHRITVAFDTKVFANSQDTVYLAPTAEDVSSGVVFALAHQSNHMSWFLDYQWVNQWLLELFKELAPEPSRLKIHPDDLNQDIEKKTYQGHYLNFLALVGTEIQIPKVKILSNRADDVVKAIPVDLVLDVGNSRTCGILIEDHAQDTNGLNKRYNLSLRDLTKPERICSEPFESRIEFAQASFGKAHWSVQSGRRDAFQWPTIARIGPEAGRLAGSRQGNEGSTGLSSPKRYLWDDALYEQGWRFNSSYVVTDHEPYATAEPLSGLINEYGEALHILRDDVSDESERKIPVFHPKYSRSSLMTFMLAEVLMHALSQINSPTQRSRLAHARSPRRLRSIILTIPPAMPKPEREIFRRCMQQAIGLIWKSLAWDRSYDDLDFSSAEGRRLVWPTLPEVHIQWDEATCGQVVYLFNETQNNYAGRPDEFFRALARPDKAQNDRITIATIDIGGGTTDLVINDYSLQYGAENTQARNTGANAYIIPEQRFRDGFKVAGDDILLDIIRDVVIPSLSQGLKNRGLSDPDPLLSQLIGKQAVKVQEALLRQQLTLQVFSQIGLRILSEYENFDPYAGQEHLIGATFRSLLENALEPSEHVLDYINEPLRRELQDAQFSILDLPLHVDLNRIHTLFIRGDYYDICKTLNALCEVINSYQCDVLLVTGRPSRLPGIQSFLMSQLPLPAGRILPLHQYRTGSWYPFHKQGRIDDPKTTAAVGAMLCFLSKSLRLPNFYFSAAAIKAYSTVKYFGLLDNNNVMSDSNVYYSDIDLDNEDYEFPETEFEVRGQMRLGFRQLNVERWTAAPLYSLTIEDPGLRSRLADQGVVIKVGLEVKTNDRNEKFSIKSASASDGRTCRRNQDIKLHLNTMADAGIGETQYWLDSGSVKR